MKHNQHDSNEMAGFFSRYEKWFVGYALLRTLPLIPVIVILVIAFFLRGMNNLALSNHPYESYLIDGFAAGIVDGRKDNASDKTMNHLNATPWEKYKDETSALQKEAIKEIDDYLKQFPEEERGKKRAEMKLNNIELPLSKKLNKRFTKRKAFYMELVSSNIQRENYKSDEEYDKARQAEAWKLGYDYGYGLGRYEGGWGSESL